LPSFKRPRGISSAGALIGVLLFTMMLTPGRAAPDPMQLASAAMGPDPMQLASAQTPGPKPSGSADETIAPGRLVVKFRASSSAEEAAQVIAEEGLTSRRPIGRTGARVVHAEAGREREAIERLARRPQVEYAEPDYVVRKLDFVPADPLYAANQWDLPKINMVDAWNVTRGSSAVKVAVIDSGIMLNHPDLIGQWSYAAGQPAVAHVFLSTPLSDGCIVPGEPSDDDGHGTHVAGTIAAASTIAGAPAVGIAGVAPGVRVMPIKALDCEGSGYLSDLAAAVDFAAANGAAFINMSLGARTRACPSYMQNAVNNAAGNGVLVIAAAGNDGDTTINYPAGCAGVVGVGATNSSDNVATFSNRNTTVKISAPGVGIASTWKDGGYASVSGTSMASPHVAGCAALVKSANPTLNGVAIQMLLQNTAEDLGTAGYDTSFGAGRLNCGAAVKAALPGSSTPSPTATAPSGPTATPTASPTATPVTAGGRGFAVSSGNGGVRLTWQGGTGQSGYQVLRLAGGTTTALPFFTPLAADATSYVDTLAPLGGVCYLLLPLGTNPQVLSDLVCTIVGFHTPTGSPQDFTLRLNESSSASLSWGPPANATPDAYLLIPLGGTGQALAGTATSAKLSASGFSCYLLAAMRTGSLVGYSDILCGVPGVSNMGAVM
jgi:subtilisin family serine protease